MTELLGWLVVKFTKASYNGAYWKTKKRYGWGVSLGRYIIFGHFPSANDYKHEYGHYLQYKKHPHLYLWTVGIVSFTRNIYARIKHKDSKWYYGSWPENEADKLGGVER